MQLHVHLAEAFYSLANFTMEMNERGKDGFCSMNRASWPEFMGRKTIPKAVESRRPFQ